MRTLICSHCGKSFTQSGKGRNSTRCSEDCKRAADNLRQAAARRKAGIPTKGVGRTLHTLICTGCGQEFRHINPKHQFCTSNCANKAHGAAGVTVKLRTATYTCRYCGKQYRPKQLDRVDYCSRECFFADIYDKKLATDAAEAIIREAKHQRICSICGVTYEAVRGVFCSDECRKESARRDSKARDIRSYVPRHFHCKECGEVVETKYGDRGRNTFCSRACCKSWGKKHANKESRANSRHIRRARLHNCQYERVNRKAVYARDGFICQICHLPVDMNLKHPDLMSPTLDHIVPLAKGGAHTFNNCQLAHMICNSTKRDLLLNIMGAGQISPAYDSLTGRAGLREFSQLGEYV